MVISEQQLSQIPHTGKAIQKNFSSEVKSAKKSFDQIASKSNYTGGRKLRGVSEPRDDHEQQALIVNSNPESEQAYKSTTIARGNSPYQAISPPSHASYTSEVSTPKKGASTTKAATGTASPQEHSFDKVWNRQTSYYTQVSKTKDILPVLKHLVESLE